MGVVWSQTFPAAPSFTEENCPSLAGKIIIVTGATSGCGFEVVKILYNKGAKVYLTARTDAKGQHAVREIQRACPRATGQLEYFILEFNNLASIKAGADACKAKENRVDILYNNAGVAAGAGGARSAQGIDIHFAVNNLGPFLFTHYLLPEIKASSEPRVIWSSSMIVDANPIKGGLVMDELDNPPNDPPRNYATSKVGNWLLASEFARRYGRFGIISVAENPGNLKTPVWKDQSKMMMLMMSPILKPAKLGALTMLYAGVSPDVDESHNGGFIVPWGKFHPSPRKDLLDAMKSKEEGGTGLAIEFWDWCTSKTKGYM
ncbi:MAG: hypothetical protein M1821_002540 [Bathelium mastoideum]|nr:MAG: hypothetical protein M1821_002540 [Bathelium mastoideum]